MSKKKAVKAEFPETLIVQKEQDRDDEYLIAVPADEVGILPNEERVGIYQLIAVKTVRVEQSLE